ncbi:MAG: redox-sensing transcriptional repressor Rex [Bacteroidales bacterium]|nr:redox-sensing transcriptional repressor Rex [Bacteroidales bacterium]MCF8388299.1 redox-sensing transcriptional repressor Rex [Bacteroidales bacterium]MCF8398945.1 redox-sensing transcriptional repressor Rex [Bacteroidales bacterium]
MKLPGKTVQRLSRYRRILYKYRYLEEPYIFSHDLARLLNINPVQVRRDLMLIGGSGNHRKGYHVKELMQLIGEKIDSEKGRKIILVGIGKLGQAIAEYLSDREMFQDIIALFDIDPVKVGKTMYDIPCFDIRDLSQMIKKKKVSIAILTVPSDYAVTIAELLIDSGIEGILNFTSVRLNTPENVFVQDFDIITSLEEMSYRLSLK